MRYKLYVFSILLLLSYNSKGQIPQYIADSLQNVLNINQGESSIPGISVAINIPEMGIWKGTSGESYDGTAMESEMVLGIASNTKTFTAVLMLKLLQNNIISLSDSLHKWLINYEHIDSTITIKQLLRHNTGLADFWDINFFTEITSDPERVWNFEEVLELIGTPLFNPGENVSYSNTNYILAGMIIESATGISYHNLVRDSILIPLGLTNTYLEGFEPIYHVTAHPWRLGLDYYSTPRIALGTASSSVGCIKSTPEDMVTWYDNLFNNSFLPIQ